MFLMSKILKELISLVALGVAILAELRKIRKVVGQRAPGLVFIKVLREEEEMLFFTLALPPAGASDVVKRTLVVKVGGGDEQTISLSGTDVVTEELSGNDNDAVVGTLVDTDDAGNDSPAREFSFVLTDTIAPPQPGELGITVVREE